MSGRIDRTHDRRGSPAPAANGGARPSQEQPSLSRRGARAARPRDARGQGRRPAHGLDGRGSRSARRSTRSSPTTQRRRSAVIVGDRRINEVQRRGLRRHHDDHRHPAAGRPRPALPADAGPRDLRARADGRPRLVGRQAGSQAGTRPAAQGLRRPAARWPRCVADQVHGILHALVDIDVERARAVAAADDEIDDLYHAHLRRGRRAHAPGPRERRPRHAHPLRRALPRADRRPGHEHRRGHRLPRLRRQIEDLNP